MAECPCCRCTMELVERSPMDASDKLFGVVDPRLSRMFLCVTCGNKRCPHAADHRNTCSGSNKPGQRGSLYEDARLPAPPASVISPPAAADAMSAPDTKPQSPQTGEEAER